MTTSSSRLPSYEELFGKLAFRDGDEARSVYSPAAYLADLLQLLDDSFAPSHDPALPNLHQRRPDIRSIPLNAESTFTEVPYLDIVNTVLAGAIGGDAYAALKTARYPLSLPFHLENEQYKQYLQALTVSAAELYRLFTPQPDPARVARERLGLSPEEYGFLKTELGDEAAVKACYGLDEHTPLGELSQIERFLKVTGLSGAALRELLFQGLDDSAQAQAAAFFINHGLDGYVTLDAEQDAESARLVWRVVPTTAAAAPATAQQPNPIPAAWFERVSRFVMLARKIGMTFGELDQALRSYCDARLDEAALRTLAVVHHLRAQYTLPLDVLYRLFHPPIVLERGDGMTPGDLLAPQSKESRRWLTRALRLSERDLTAIVTQYGNRFPADERPRDGSGAQQPDLAAFLYRVSALAEVLDISHAELFCLLEILERDPSIRTYNHFDLLAAGDSQPLDCYRVLAAGESAAILWLVELLLAIVQWMQASGFGSHELAQILSGRDKTPAEQARRRAQKIAALDNLYQQCKPAMLDARLFVSDRFDERSARVIFETVTSPAAGLASRKDRRLVRFVPALATAAAHRALAGLAVIRAADFMHLGIEERLLDKLFRNLILRGYLAADGTIVEERLPAQAADFVLAGDFQEQREPLFMIVHDLFSDEDREEALNAAQDAVLDIALYPSDLNALEELTAAECNELYDNLIYNGYIDAEGMVLRADFFAQTEHVADFAVNADLRAVAGAVYNRLLSQIQRFAAAPLPLDLAIFAELPLAPAEVEALVRNLRFNQYLDAHNAIADKRALLKQDAADLNLAMEFAPLQAPIRAALRQFVGAFQASFYTLTRESFRDVADAVVAGQVLARLDQEYLHDGSPTQATSAFFLDPENRPLFQAGPDFSAADSALVFDRVASLLIQQQPYRLPVGALADLDFDAAETAELLEELTRAGHLSRDLFLPEDRISFFLQVDNALTFAVEAFEDYTSDIFFMLHDVAKETAAAIDEIVGALSACADDQIAVVLAVLQEALGVDGEVARVICQHVLRGLDNLVDTFLPPVLATVDARDRVTQEPADPTFNRLYRRMEQFALLAARLGLSAQETAIAFRDQDLVEKYPENLVLPPGVDRFDALWASPEGTIYLFKDTRYWTYAARDYALLTPHGQPISALSDHFAALTQIDAAFTDSDGASVIIGRDQNRRSRFFHRASQSRRWVEKTRAWGQFKNNFADPAAIDTAFQDKEGKTYLFSGDQYIRYSGADFSVVDEGYPRTIAGNWQREGANAQLSARFQTAIDASFQGADGKTYLFKDQHYVCSDAPAAELEIRSRWGRVRNNFLAAARLDAAYADGGKYYLFSGDQVIVYQDSLENDGVAVCEGYPRRIEAHFPNLPAEFESGLEAAFVGADKRIHLFKDGQTVAIEPGKPLQPVRVETSWGLVANRIRDRRKVDAAFVGLDGKTYLFCDDQYVRYSGADYTQVDEGYPRTIAGDWGGLRSVDAAFVLDGKTYLFGKGDSDTVHYVRYSGRDYRTQDEGYPRTPNDNWWNLPVALVQAGAPFSRIDAVFNGKDDRTYLFSGGRFIAYDNKERWWSEPQDLRARWDSIPFDHVDAAFVGRDGKTYIFAGNQYVRYSTSNYSKIDDRYPNTIHTFWGNVVNNIAKTGKVDAALVVESQELVDGAVQTRSYTYLFSGNQYFRYAGNQYTTVESGYPRYIATSLAAEPRFTNLPASFANGLDAAFADQRNIYLFKDATWYVVADSLYKVYDLNVPGAGCAVVDEGALLVETAGGWRHYGALEGRPGTPAPVDPVFLRAVPEAFRRGLNAVLKGTDQNTYLFKGADCFNVLLNKQYPLAEEWGLPRNNIALNNQIDAAFVGRDQKTYVFSGDQFVTYSGATYLDAEIDGLPQPIAAHWGGLSNVALAYVRGEKTYLLEQADSEGNFRYVCYSTADYTQPDAGYPQTADQSFWQIPTQYRAEGFTEVRAVLVEGENLFLIGPEQYLQFHETTGVWSYPRALGRAWRTIPLDRLTFPGVRTAFTGADGATYFFGEGCYTRYAGGACSPLAAIKERWGRVHNNFANNPMGNTIDAAFVYRGQITYLFSGDQYVRYSSSDYRTVDPGYPRTILGNLRQEPAFQNLPDSFEELLAERLAQRITPLIDSIVANERTLYLFLGTQCHVVSQSLTATYGLGAIGRVINRLADTNTVDAAFVGLDAQGQRQTFLFAGDQYVRYSGDAYDAVDDGYPRTIANSFASEIGLGSLPPAFRHGIDAALCTEDGGVYLFRGKEYLFKGRRPSRARTPAPTPIRATWGKVRNGFVDDPADTTIDAAFLAPGGGLYVFKKDQYVRYQTTEQQFVDEGYPRAIKDNWGDLPIDFEAGIDGGFVFEGKTYLLKGDAYVRYSAADYARMDAIYPQRFAHRWGPWADYLLSDITTIARFKQLQEQHAGAAGRLADFLAMETGAIHAPYELLAAIFGWDPEEVKWLKRHNGFLGGRPLLEEQFQLELVLKLFDIFALAGKLGAAPSDVYTNIWQQRFAGAAGPDADRHANEALRRYLAAVQGEKEWPALERQLHNALNLLKRDALIAYGMARAAWSENARDLYERYLIDVEMGSAGVASRIQEAIAATQLYIHRYLVNLEPLEAKDDRDEEVRQALKGWWKWMKNYRVWEANRKVFLYPENYIRPELRDTKTPAFKTLEDDLLQGEITAATVQRAYKKYLDEYTEVSRLTIAGGYVYQPPEASGIERRLVLFGRTKTDPRRYYYRTAEFLSGEKASALWSPWLSVNVQIDADLVYPVFAFDRVFVFWTKVETVATAATSTTLTRTPGNGTETISSNAPASYAIKIFYSFYNLNKEWVPAQTLKWGSGETLTDSIKHGSRITDVKLFVESSNKLIIRGDADDHENIIVNCSYRMSGADGNRAFSLTPELYCKETAKPNFSGSGADVFDRIFDEPTFDEAGVVRFNALENSTDGPWFSFDHKGGSFLCRPAEPALESDVWPHWLAGNTFGLPQDWRRIDAALAMPDGTTCLFNTETHRYRTYTIGSADTPFVPVAEGDPRREQDIRQRWGKRRNRIAEDGKVDAGITLDGKSYLFRDTEYLTYSTDLELADADSPKILANNADGLPTAPVSAAFTGLDHTSYFFHNATRQFTTRANGALSAPGSVSQTWGRMRPAPVTLAFTSGAHTYLVSGDRYLRYDGNSYTRFEAGYPQAYPGIASLPGFSSVELVSAINPRRIANAFSTGGLLYFQYRGEEQFRRLPLGSGAGPDGGEFLRRLSEAPPIAVAVNGARIYLFQRTNAAVVTLSIYDADARAAEEQDEQQGGRRAGRRGDKRAEQREEQEAEQEEQRGRWTHHAISITNQGTPMAIDHALVGSDGQFYLFAGDDYMRSGDWATLIAGGSIPWSRTGGILKDWLLIDNRIAETGEVDGAFVRGDHTYLVSGDQYVRYTGDRYDYIDAGYPKPLRGNTEALPDWDRIGGIFQAHDSLVSFFDNRDSSRSYVMSQDLQRPLPTRSRWGIIRNAITESGVDVAYMRDRALFLVGGGQFVRYTLGPGDAIGDFIDDGYPRHIALAAEAAAQLPIGGNTLPLLGIARLDAAYERSGSFYLFAGDRTFTLRPGVEPDALPAPQFMQGNWGNLPQELRTGFDTALTHDTTLYLFKGGQFARYAGKARPYAITEARYRIVRLTTSTAYMLNQRLFAGGVPALLSVDTQETDELPAFSEREATPTSICVRKDRAEHPPISSHLDFDSANGIYYWEIFFHAPFLIAQTLNAGQKFAEAKEWYEYIYDPTERAGYWKFLPFLTVDVQALIDSCETVLRELEALQAPVAGLKATFGTEVFPRLRPWVGVFQQHRVLTVEEEKELEQDLGALSTPLRALDGALAALRSAPSSAPADPTEQARARRIIRAIADLQERVAIMGKLWQRYELLGNQDAQLRSYLNDPFDPHAIAALRTIAYRKAVVMSYIDNLLDWGDMLFRQYTRESIDEARMLYILAYDLLGEQPLDLGTQPLGRALTYAELDNTPDTYDMVIYPKGTLHDSVASRYFFVPENSLFRDYWTRVEDRLYKIRQSLNILGISQPLPLFQPPIDPMALVQAAAGGAGVAGALAGMTAPVPHYRFSFMLRKSQELVQKLNGFGADLLAALEKKDAEDLSLLQNRQEAVILGMTRTIKVDQLKAAGETIKELESSLQGARDRVSHYRGLIAQGLSPIEQAQIAMMLNGANASFASVGLKIAAGIAYLIPDVTVGLFSFGAKTGGLHAGDALSGASEASQSLSEGFSMAGEVLGIYASHLRSLEDWRLQLSTAQSDVVQIEHQLAGARLQEQIAQRELEIHDKQVEHNAAIMTFMQRKFTSAQLYQWMAGRLAGLYYQSYGLAYEMAKGAEKAFQYERGVQEREASYIQPLYWETQRNGLLAGASLGLDLDRMEKAYIDGDSRGFEITRRVSLLELDPVALLQLKSSGVCEFALGEALFDSDFPGHYCRQIRTVALAFVGADGQGLPVNATLTQLGHKTVLEPDARAVKYLLDPKDQPPLTLRSDWKTSQQIVLSEVAEGEQNNGLFELRYDDERYLPFEGTGAVSTWRLELNGRKGAFNVGDLLDVTITLKYTAEQGGAAFASAVKGLLKPTASARLFDVARDFPDEWQEFVSNGDQELILTFTRDLFPGMSSSRITNLFARYELNAPSQVSFVLNDDETLTLKDGKLVTTSGLSIGSRGSEWRLALNGDKAALENISLVLGYTSKVS
ncbi:MAG TPA: hemopexin repeat-containing protein [Roseiflexaceae bacterium]|nr:hemopexin repeat-containing protein [Roseiflexaceae bacterium]